MLNSMSPDTCKDSIFLYSPFKYCYRNNLIFLYEKSKQS